MAGISVIGAVVQTFDGHAINDGIHYRAYIDSNVTALPQGRSVVADVDFDFPVFVGVEKQSRTFNLHILLVGSGNFHERMTELKRWFNTQSGQEQYLVATFEEDRRIACRPVSLEWKSGHVIVTLEAYSPYWESNEEETVTFLVDSDGDSAIVTNRGNIATVPEIEVSLTAEPANTWLWRRNVLVTNWSEIPLTHYPLELTNGWDTAALVANAAKATQIDDGDGITDADTTITVDSTTGFYGRGLIYIGTEQIFYASKDATHFLDCERGVGGTTAASHADNDAVYQSEMYADGRDVQIELDGKVVSRWWGAGMGEAKGPNHSDSRLWVVIPSLIKRSADNKDGYLLNISEDYAKNQPVNVHSATGGYGGANLVDDKSSTFWQTAFTGGWAAIDLQSKRLINRVLIFHPNSADAPKDFTIQTSTDGMDYTVQETVTNNTVKNAYTVHDFNTVEAEYVKLNVTALQGGTKCTVCTMSVYYAQPRLVIKYGNWDVPEYSGYLDTKPIFNLATSSNTIWDYKDFIDDRYPNRAAQWVPFQYHSAAYNFRKYATSKDGEDADPAAVLGIAEAYAAPFHDGYKLYHPCGVTRVVHSGFTKMNTAYRTWRLGAVDVKGGNVPSRYENTTNNANAWTAYGPITTDISLVGRTVYFYFFHKATTTSLNYAEVTDATLTLTDVPSVSFRDPNAAGTVYQMACEIENKANQQKLDLNGLVTSDTPIAIDCRRFTVKDKISGANKLTMLSLPSGAVRIPWLELEPGDNEIAYNDTAVGGVLVTLKYRSRWL